MLANASRLPDPTEHCKGPHKTAVCRSNVTRDENGNPIVIHNTRQGFNLEILMVYLLQRKLMELEGPSRPLQTNEEQSVNVIVQKGKVSNNKALKPYGVSPHPMGNNKMRQMQRKRKRKNKQKLRNRWLIPWQLDLEI
eukprot:Blabericola_migrator_1__6393@NODE_3221_length_1938_cov_7_917157_g2016_i0_p1_GENE_NODE_3221_length_1938_cov_7_917157_g2016_i0NODE_3221_length_1938_cov_7_917157_g2016_i0_p1_ORF_typecomplete_len138_score19_96_NODE_3221_length_1938_cov_7_917157_g2016_i013421755